jgi:hypothetical protein
VLVLPLQDGWPSAMGALALGLAYARGVVRVMAQGVTLGGPAGFAGTAVGLLGLAEGKAVERLLYATLAADFALGGGGGASHKCNKSR